jgi:hypothetical protein
MIMYRTTGHGCPTAKIEELEVLRETGHQVVLYDAYGEKEMRQNKRSEWTCWHATWEDAHQFLIDEAQKVVDRFRRLLQQANGSLGNIKGMRKP